MVVNAYVFNYEYPGAAIGVIFFDRVISLVLGLKILKRINRRVSVSGVGSSTGVITWIRRQKERVGNKYAAMSSKNDTGRNSSYVEEESKAATTTLQLTESKRNTPIP
jgi:hypothetical protein